MPGDIFFWVLRREAGAPGMPCEHGAIFRLEPELHWMQAGAVPPVGLKAGRAAGLLTRESM